MKLNVSIFSLLVFLFGPCVNCDIDYHTEYYSSSIVGLVKLLDIENQFVLRMKEYAEALEEKLATLKIYLKTLERKRPQSEKEQKQYLANPLHEFSLIRRLRQDWPTLQKYTKQEVGAEQLQAMTELLVKAPNEDDMLEMLKGIDRIEYIYDLNPIDMSLGRLQDREFGQTLSIRDCLALAQHKYEKKDYGGAFAWYSIALKREREPKAFTYDKVLGTALNGVREQFAKMRFLKVMAKQEPLLSDKQVRDEVEKALNKSSPAFVDHFVNELLEQEDGGVLWHDKKLQEPYYLGCRGGYPKRTNLHCRYNTTTTPFLRLAPFKMEEVSLDPYIVLYHNVISDREIEDMKQHATNFANGLSISPDLNVTDKPQIVARMQWVRKMTPFTDRINLRITDITGFEVDEFKAVQIGNYGIGGHFMPHFDYTTPDRLRIEDIYGLGDRTATIVFYASEVQGGATVFPNIQVTVQPQKGSALHWYNLFDDDSPNPLSLHTACPVISGSRWTLTKFIHSDSQLFRKPCLARNA
ncbi:prolyl 4-hydroxylase subunit alpha-1 [Drosophila mojavensis]|uniref:prolyl 4-hydroxylase subunit alpha-1 n=1 Tax=Drosophila mojavensis TaxID=7230 RepID=UPI001CD15D33|nr:prolyl 4-hydroxylase subunit alpha-1 [Drosophila mojavensis]